MLTANIIIQVNPGHYKLIVTFDGVESTSADVAIDQNNAIATLSIYQSFRWVKGLVIELKLQSNNGQTISVLPASSWSMSFIGESNVNFREFSSFLTTSQYINRTDDRYSTLSIDLATLQTNLNGIANGNGYQQRGQFISPPGYKLNLLSRYEAATTDLF